MDNRFVFLPGTVEGIKNSSEHADKIINHVLLCLDQFEAGSKCSVAKNLSSTELRNLFFLFTLFSPMDIINVTYRLFVHNEQVPFFSNENNFFGRIKSENYFSDSSLFATKVAEATQDLITTRNKTHNVDWQDFLKTFTHFDLKHLASAYLSSLITVYLCIDQDENDIHKEAERIFSLFFRKLDNETFIKAVTDELLQIRGDIDTTNLFNITVFLTDHYGN